MRPEYEAIAAAGFELQLDCPDLAMSRHTGYQDLDEADFLQDRRSQCRGAQRRHRRTSRPSACGCTSAGAITKGRTTTTSRSSRSSTSVLKARPATILFEAANPRHEHEWIVWRDAGVPDDKMLAPGLIDTCSNYVEHPELIAQRIERFAAIVGADRVVASTDCGFGTFAGYGKIDPASPGRSSRAAARRRAPRGLEGLVGHTPASGRHRAQARCLRALLTKICRVASTRGGASAGANGVCSSRGCTRACRIGATRNSKASSLSRAW